MRGEIIKICFTLVKFMYNNTHVKSSMQIILSDNTQLFAQETWHSTKYQVLLSETSIFAHKKTCFRIARNRVFHISKNGMTCRHYTRWRPLTKQKIQTFSKHLVPIPVFMGLCDLRSLKSFIIFVFVLPGS